jgi:hypothetical protein
MNAKTIREVMKQMGRKGGKKGGKVAAANMTPEERTARAKKAAAKSSEVRSLKAKQRSLSSKSQ